MWSPTRHFQQLCAPLIRVAASAMQPSTLWSRSYHLLTLTTTNTGVISLGALNQLKSTAVARFPKDRAMLDTCNATPLFNQSCGFKFKRVLKRRCKDCYYVVRENRLHVICKTHPRHKQLAITQPEKSTWILTHAMQSKVRPY